MSRVMHGVSQLLLAIGICSDVAFAADVVDPHTITVPESSVFDSMDISRNYLSDKIVDYSKRMDQFFGDKRYLEDHNNSIIMLETSTTMEAGGNVASAFNGIAKLDLPAAQRRFQLVLESDPENNTAGDVTQGQPVVAKKPVATKRLAASLRFEKAEKKHWYFSSETGIIAQFPLDPFARLRGRYESPIGDWRLNVAETVFWFSTIGLGETTQIDMEHILSEPVLFRATSTATCFEEPQNCGLRQDFSILQTLNEHTGLIYEASVLGSNKPQLEETAYVLQLRYRYRVHREWIFVEVNPQLNFPRTDEYKLNAVLFLKLEMIFGGYNQFM